VLACFYLFFATGFMPSQPYGVAFDYTGWKFLLWACKTPWLLAQLAALAGMPNTELGAMLFWDAVMLLAGFGAQAAATSEGVWPLFVVGCAAQAILFDAQGPFVKIGNATGSGSNVILSEGAGGAFAAPGHNSVITDDAGQDFIFYHAYRAGDLAGPRMLLMDRIVYDASGWPRVGEPSSTPQLAPTVNGVRGGGGGGRKDR
jgi:hypothetical protein